jgi:uncharacterized membrane protein
MQQPTRTFTDKIFLILKGMAMGTANKVPGVSGGIVAYVAGFYEEFIQSLRQINSKTLGYLARGKFAKFYVAINGRFLFLIILGELISYFTISKGLDVLLAFFPIMVWALFFGMIIGSIYYIGRAQKWNQRNLMILAVGTALGVATSLLDPATDNENLLFVFFCGMVSVSGMTIPGLSGSFILILLGNYVLLMVDAVNSLFNTVVFTLQGNFSWLEDSEHMRLLGILGVFVLGSFVGLVLLSHILGWTMRHYKWETNAAILGFITGSLGTVWPWKKEIFATDSFGGALFDANGDAILLNYQRYWPSLTDLHTWLALFWIAFGFLIVFLLDRYAGES